MSAEGRTKEERREAMASLGRKEGREVGRDEAALSLLLLDMVVVDLYEGLYEKKG